MLCSVTGLGILVLLSGIVSEADIVSPEEVTAGLLLPRGLLGVPGGGCTACHGAAQTTISRTRSTHLHTSPGKRFTATSF